MYNKTGNIVARFLSRHAVLTLNGFNSIKDLLSYFAKVVKFFKTTVLIAYSYFCNKKEDISYDAI